MIKIEKIATEKAKELNKLRGYTSNGLTFISIYTAIVDAFQEFEKYNDKKLMVRGMDNMIMLNKGTIIFDKRG